MKTFSASTRVTVMGALFLTAASAEASAYGDKEVSIRGQLCALEWSAHAGGNSAVGPQEHLAKFDCNNPDGDLMFLESGTRKVYAVRQGNKCYLEWAAAKQTAPGIWEHERVATFDCGGSKRGDPLRIVERPPVAIPVNPPGIHTKPVEQDCIRVKQKRSIWRLFIPAYAFKPRIALARVRVMCRPAGSTGVYE